MGPIGVAEHLAPFLPGTRWSRSEASTAIGRSAPALGAAPSHPADLVDVHRDDGPAGLTQATEVAILSANYIAKRLEGHYPSSTRARRAASRTSSSSTCRPLEKSGGVTVEDIAKRLMDYGFHAPTMSWPVAGTLMIEPTESESKPSSTGSATR
jgi:glycine dehydrogenase